MAGRIISQVDFIEYLQGLAAEGETSLIVRQKPKMKGGQPLVHVDGTAAYVWMPSLPENFTARGQGSWYGNTGSFILSRFVDGKLSASAANCEYVLVMVLDDIGTKSKAPSLEPTWKIETSAGNYQWGYTFSIDGAPTKNEFSAAIKAIAAAGYTDGGAINPVRNFRLPGSVNLKPGKNFFESRLLEFHPEREFTLEQICAALGVVPGTADTAQTRFVKLADGGGDDVLAWLSENNEVIEEGNAEGWYGVLCPNSDEHTDGNPMARYHPTSRSFCCWHEHCSHINSSRYLEIVAGWGAPKHTPGIRPELLHNAFNAALSTITPTGMFTKTTDALLEEMDSRELGRVQKGEWHKRFAYVLVNDSYFDLEFRREVSRTAFNAIFRHVPCASTNGGRRIEASVHFDERREVQNATLLTNLTYAAGEGTFVGIDGDLYGNRWVNARPDITGQGVGDISIWLDLLSKLVPAEKDREHLLDIMAFKLQEPAIKINHAVLHVGDEGCGKDTLWAPFIWSVCGPRLRNRGYMDSDTIGSQWGYDLESEILIINELKEPDASSRRALANKLKPIIAAPPEMLNINRKGLHPYQMANRGFVLAFSNEQIPITLALQDRRWFCIFSEAPRMRDEEGAAIWSWFNQGGFAQIAAYLWSRDVSAFMPGAAPVMTEYKMNLIEHGRSIAEAYIIEMIRSRAGEFSPGIICSPYHAFCDRLAGAIPSGVKVPPAALFHALKEAGWRDCGRISSVENPSKKHVFAEPSKVLGLSNSQIRNMVEPKWETNNVVAITR